VVLLTSRRERTKHESSAEDGLEIEN